jgi:hypothetical protein
VFTGTADDAAADDRGADDGAADDAEAWDGGAAAVDAAVLVAAPGVGLADADVDEDAAAFVPLGAVPAADFPAGEAVSDAATTCVPPAVAVGERVTAIVTPATTRTASTPPAHASRRRPAARRPCPRWYPRGPLAASPSGPRPAATGRRASRSSW